jgi:competence protein ComEA|tara:strand:- start:2373 stop:2573 length:201 start_codon:yes stop_codon:yes gene_type:complete
LIDLNTASANLLDTLPGIGPALAQAIIDFRENVHPFQSVVEVQEVQKIGPVTYENMRELVTVSRSP